MPGEAFTLPSFAKINLHLEVGGKRDDGYHELCTVFQTISLSDRITFESSDVIRFTCDDPSIPLGGDNLVVKAANLLQSEYSVDQGAAIYLEKKIPSPGGLGGGSSNAATALIGLSRLWNIDIDIERLHSMAAELGADVPFFLYGGTAVGSGRGNIIEPVTDIACENILIVTPDIAVLTADAFASFHAASLTNAGRGRILLNCRFEAEAFDVRTSPIRNDLEAAVFAAHPEIAEIKRTLLYLGAQIAGMSGSGASIFAIFENKETRQTALKALEQRLNWRTFVVAAVSRNEYREALNLM